MRHLTEDELEKLLANRLHPAGQGRIVRHLLAGCGFCSRKLVERAPERLLEQAGEGRHRRVAQSAPRDRALVAAVEQESRWRVDETKLARSFELLGRAPGHEGLTLHEARSLQGSPRVEALVRRSFELRYQDPKTMRWLAFNAVRTVESLRPEEHDPTSLSDLKAQAWLQLANAYKINNQLAEAESALDRARAALRRGGNDLRLLGWAVKVESALRNAQRRLAEACELMDGAYRLYLKLEDRHLAGLALISKAVYLGHGTQYAESLLLYRRGIPLLDPDRDPQLSAIAQQGLITSLVGGGRHGEAGRLFLRSDLRHQLSNVPNIRWMEGRLLAGLGKNSKAEKALMEVREVFLGQGQEYTAAVVGLDLLPIWSLQGRSGMVRAAAGEIFDTLQSLGIRKEAAKARAYLQ